MLGALSVAGKPYLTTATVPGQCIVLICPKHFLLLRIRQGAEPCVHDVTQLILRIDIKITGINIAGMFHRHYRPAGSAKDTGTGFHTHPHFQRYIKQLDEDSTYILPHPLIEDETKKAPILFCLNRSRSDLS